MTTLPARTPWHLWAVGAISLLWNAFGANDYLQTQLGNLEYMEGMVTDMGVSAEAALAYFIGFPGWVHAFWALGVWSSVLGSVLLLMRLRYAVWALRAGVAGARGHDLLSGDQRAARMGDERAQRGDFHRDLVDRHIPADLRAQHEEQGRAALTDLSACAPATADRYRPPPG